MDKPVEYTVDYRNVKHPRLEYETGALLLILPKTLKNEKQILENTKNGYKGKSSP